MLPRGSVFWPGGIFVGVENDPHLFPIFFCVLSFVLIDFTGVAPVPYFGVIPIPYFGYVFFIFRGGPHSLFGFCFFWGVIPIPYFSFLQRIFFASSSLSIVTGLLVRDIYPGV